jgi:NADH-quinone oxidoreductase subunit E
MDRLKQTITEAVHGQSQPTVTVLSSLLAVQDAVGYIPREALEEVAAFNGKTVNDVWAVASFYPNFRFEPLCQHNVEVCWGTTCHLVGAMSIMGSVLDAAGLAEAGDTKDKRLSVGYNTCLGACSQAPVISIDHHLAGRVSPESAASWVAGLLAQPPEDSPHGS